MRSQPRHRASSSAASVSWEATPRRRCSGRTKTSWISGRPRWVPLQATCAWPTGRPPSQAIRYVESSAACWSRRLSGRWPSTSSTSARVSSAILTSEAYGAPRTLRSARSHVEEAVVPVLYVEDAARAVGWYERLGFHKEWEHQFEPGFP